MQQTFKKEATGTGLDDRIEHGIDLLSRRLKLLSDGGCRFYITDVRVDAGRYIEVSRGPNVHCFIQSEDGSFAIREDGPLVNAKSYKMPYEHARDLFLFQVMKLFPRDARMGVIEFLSGHARKNTVTISGQRYTAS